MNGYFMKNHQHCFEKLRFLTIICVFFIPLAVYADSGWNIINDTQGIHVYNRDVTGSEIKEFKAEAVIDAPMEVIFEVMSDAPAETQWMDNCIESRMLKTIKEFTYTSDSFYVKNLVYHAVGAPFPVNKRDFILETEMKGDKKTRSITVNFHAVTDSGIPAKKDYVRMTDLKGSWTFVYIDSTHTKAVYQVKQNPGGNLSSYIINYVNKEIPFKTIIGLRKIVKNEIYIHAAKQKKDLYVNAAAPKKESGK